MILCICHNISDSDLDDDLKKYYDGLLTLKELKEKYGIGKSCGKCIQYVVEERRTRNRNG